MKESFLPVFNVIEFGATRFKEDNAQKAIQTAIDTCAESGGGTVYFPAGAYSSGTIHLRSHVRLYLEAGATIYSIKEKSAFDKDALIYGEDLENITIEGRGTIDGQGRYEMDDRFHDDDFIRPNRDMMVAKGKPLTRSFPKPDQFGRMFLLLRCKDVRIADLSLIDSPSWTIHPYGCERLVIDGVYIHSSIEAGVWADGIDPDGCKDVRISNCTIETGDDAIVFYSMNWHGPALPCENITVTNCRLTSASSAIKFCDGNMNAVRNVTIDNCVISGANRGIAFMVFDGGVVSDVVLSNLVVDCTRHDWFWWGDGDPLHFNIKRRSDVHSSIAKGTDLPAGTIQNILINNVIAHGKGSSICNGHTESWLKGITIQNLKLHISSDTDAPYDKAQHCLKFEMVEDLKLKDVEVFWDLPEAENWESALYLQEVKGLTLDGFKGRQAIDGSDTAAVILDQVESGVIRHCSAKKGTGVFIHIKGEDTKDLLIVENDFRQAKESVITESNVGANTIVFNNNYTA